MNLLAAAVGRPDGVTREAGRVGLRGREWRDEGRREY